MQHLRPESGADELPAVGRELVQHFRDRSAVLSIEVRVDFVKEVEWRRVRGLDCKDER